VFLSVKSKNKMQTIKAKEPFETKVIQSRLRHIIYSTATTQSTMDFSMMLVDDDVVDSPPNGKKCHHLVNSPSPLKCCTVLIASWNCSKFNVVPERKLYEEEINIAAATKVYELLIL